MIDTSEVWTTIDRLAKFSHSVASNNQRLMSSAFFSRSAMLGPNASLEGSITQALASSKSKVTEARESIDAQIADADPRGAIVKQSG